MPSVQDSENGESVEKSDVDAEVEEIVENLVDSGKSWLARMSSDVSKSSVAKQVRHATAAAKAAASVAPPPLYTDNALSTT